MEFHINEKLHIFIEFHITGQFQRYELIFLSFMSQGILEAVEYLLSKGIVPVRSFYIGFGHDEEVSFCEYNNRYPSNIFLSLT